MPNYTNNLISFCDTLPLGEKTFNASFKIIMFSKLVQFYKLTTNHNCAYSKQTEAKLHHSNLCFYHRSETNSSTNIMPVTHLLQLPKCSAIHCMDRKEGCCDSVFSFL